MFEKVTKLPKSGESDKSDKTAEVKKVTQGGIPHGVHGGGGPREALPQGVHRKVVFCDTASSYCGR